MKVWVYSLCWNEEMFLPFYLKHYGSFADKIIIYDHHSDDKSREIARQNKKVEIRNYDADGIHEPSVTQLYNTCYYDARGKADWVILCDIDEIVYDPYILSRLQEYKDMGITAAKVMGYTMLHGHPPTDYHHQIYRACKYGIEDHVFSKHCVFNPKLSINYAPGRHTSTFDPEPVYSHPEIKLLHYSFWGLIWLLNKYDVHYKRLSKDNINNGWGYNKFPERANDGSYYTPSWFMAKYSERREVV